MGRNLGKCIICLNYVKPKIKIAARHGLEEQLLIMFLVRKLTWTPISDESLTEYLQTGSPSDWAALCHICEKQVHGALEMHRQIMKLAYRIAEIRRNLYAENFYESDDENEDDDDVEDGDENNGIFTKLRKTIISDYRSKHWERKSVKQSLLLKYTTSTTTQGDDDDDQEANCDYLASSPPVVKREHISDEDNYSDTMMQEAVDDFFNPTEGDEIESEVGDTTSTDPEWGSRRKGKPVKKVRSSKGKEDSTTSLVLENIPHSATECPTCGKTFVCGSTMRRHYKEQHMKSKEHRCPCCNQDFARKEYLDHHIKQNHADRIDDIVTPENIDLLQCPKCPKKFQIRRSLQRHLKRFHLVGATGSNVSKSETVDEERKASDDDGNLNESKKRKRTCEICNKVFSKGTISRHIREFHEKVKEHTCDLCPKVFARKSYLNHHIHTYHSTGTSEPISCKICNKTYNSDVALASHMRKVHKQRQKSTCKICSKSFSQVASLNIHMKFAHGGEGESVMSTVTGEEGEAML